MPSKKLFTIEENPLTDGLLCGILYLMKDKKDFIVTTTNGTRWGATGTSLADVRENFNTGIFGNIANVKAGSLFTHEESEQLRREKLEHSCR